MMVAQSAADEQIADRQQDRSRDQKDGAVEQGEPQANGWGRPGAAAPDGRLRGVGPQAIR
jgi:hypothetical protein